MSESALGKGHTMKSLASHTAPTHPPYKRFRMPRLAV